LGNFINDKLAIFLIDSQFSLVLNSFWQFPASDEPLNTTLPLTLADHCTIRPLVKCQL